MTKTEPKEQRISTPDRPKNDLSFAFREVRLTPGHLWDDLDRIAEEGRQALLPIASELRAKGYEVSEPAAYKKSFGAVRMICRTDDAQVFIVIVPPDHGNRWYMTTGCTGLGRPPRQPTTRECAALETVKAIVANVANGIEGVHDSHWVLDARPEQSHRKVVRGGSA